MRRRGNALPAAHRHLQGVALRGARAAILGDLLPRREVHDVEAAERIAERWHFNRHLGFCLHHQGEHQRVAKARLRRR